MAKYIKPFLMLLVGVVVVLLFVIFALLKSKNIHLVFTVNPVTHSEAYLHWDNQLNLEQSHNACGPYSVMAYAYVVSGVAMQPETVNSEIGGRHGDGLTYPWGITQYLNQHGMQAKSFYLGLLSKTQKLDWIKHRLAQGRPVIALTGTTDWGHYVTILGYKGRVFYKYDSYLAKDLNGAMLGNSDAHEDWLAGGIEGIRFAGLAPNSVISY